MNQPYRWDDHGDQLEEMERRAEDTHYTETDGTRHRKHDVYGGPHYPHDHPNRGEFGTGTDRLYEYPPVMPHLDPACDREQNHECPGPGCTYPLDTP